MTEVMETRKHHGGCKNSRSKPEVQRTPARAGGEAHGTSSIIWERSGPTETLLILHPTRRSISLT